MITREIQPTSYAPAPEEGAITDVPQAFPALPQGAYRGDVSVRLT
jgi:hypothetical protein